MLFPDEIWVNIITNLNYRSILQLRRADPYFENLLRDGYVWYSLICKKYISIKYNSCKNYENTYINIRYIAQSNVGGKHNVGINYYTSHCSKDLDVWRFLCKKCYTPKIETTKSLLSIATTAKKVDIFFNTIFDTFHQKFSIVYNDDPNYATLLLSEPYVFGPYDNYIIVRSHTTTDIPDESMQNVYNDLCYNIEDRKCIVSNVDKDPKYINAIMKYIKDPNDYCCDNTWDKFRKRNIIFYTKTASSLA